MSDRARSFGAVAELYDRVRPGYPDALYAHVVGDLDAPRVLEAGAGTGRASVALAQRGAWVVAVEPDPAMAAVARERTAGLGVEVREGAFEDCAPEVAAYDLVVAAQAWHWVDPQRGPAVARRALRRGGRLCVWANRPADLDGPVWAAVQAAYAEHAPELDRRDRVRAQDARERALPQAPGFEAWTMRHYDWTQTYDTATYLDLVCTQSDHLLLDGGVRGRLLAAVARAIDDAGGGRLEHRYRTFLAMARPSTLSA